VASYVLVYVHIQVRQVPLASEIILNARHELVRRLDRYKTRHPRKPISAAIRFLVMNAIFQCQSLLCCGRVI
jgi:hypothetical protein